MRVMEILSVSAFVFMLSFYSGDAIEESISLFIVFTLLLSVVLEVYSFPKDSIPVEEDLKKLDEDGYPKNGS